MISGRLFSIEINHFNATMRNLSEIRWYIANPPRMHREAGMTDDLRFDGAHYMSELHKLSERALAAFMQLHASHYDREESRWQPERGQNSRPVEGTVRYAEESRGLMRGDESISDAEASWPKRWT